LKYKREDLLVLKRVSHRPGLAARGGVPGLLPGAGSPRRGGHHSKEQLGETARKQEQPDRREWVGALAGTRCDGVRIRPRKEAPLFPTPLLQV